MRIAMGVAYEGKQYAGWQLQVGIITVQQVLEEVLSKVALHPIRIVCAGRTDQGVHAKGQVFHFDTHKQREEAIWLRACNYYLPSNIRILWVKEVEKHFHARFSAQTRTYQYLIYQGNLPWFRNYALYDATCLDTKVMHQAAQPLLGMHDFQGFRSSRCQSRSSLRVMLAIDILQQKEWIICNLTANAFLHHMVRIIVGTLIEVGQGKRLVSSTAHILDIKDRKQAAAPAAPQGLYLTQVKYPKEFCLKQNSQNAWMS